MSAQTSYSLRMSAGYPGLLSGNGPKTIDTYLVETAAGIAPGVVVSQGTADDQCVIGGTNPLGIVLRNLDTENTSSDTILYALTEAVSVLVVGECEVYVATTGTKGDPIFSTDATGVISAGVASTGETQLGGELLTTLAAAGYAKIRITASVPVPVLTDGTTIEGSGITGDPISTVV